MITGVYECDWKKVDIWNRLLCVTVCALVWLTNGEKLSIIISRNYIRCRKNNTLKVKVCYFGR